MTWAQVLGWRMRRQFLDPPAGGGLAEVLGSGLGTLPKPLAWWRVLCFGPPRGNRVTFVSADALPAVPAGRRSTPSWPVTRLFAPS